MSDVNRPAISVLIPIYNVEKYLPRCLDSVLAQRFQNFEIVCVNDASPDNSIEVLRRYASTDDRIVIIDKPRNEGLMMARYTGYKNAQGDYFFFLDSDDFIPEDTLQSLYDEAMAASSDIVVGEMALVNAAGRKVMKNRSLKTGNDAMSYLRSILNWNTPSLCGSLFKRSLFDGYSYTALMRHGFSEDRILLTEILTRRNPKISVINDVTYYYWQNNDSITRKRPSDKSVTEQFKALYLCYDRVEESGLDLGRDNRNFIMRYLSLYVERGCDVKMIKSIDRRNELFLRFSELKKVVGYRLATHTWLCCHTPVYRPLMHGLRLVIRKIQGKD